MIRRAPRAAHLVATLAVVALWAAPAAAYIDPGAGSALVYVVTGVVLSVFFALRGAYYKLAELFFRSRYKQQTCDLAIHSETPRYENVFIPIVRALGKRNVPFTYFTMYPRTDKMEKLPECCTHVVIPPDLVGYAQLNHLNAKVLVTTTPQLDVMTFRKSRTVKHYCHVPHALSDCVLLRPYAYDFFDSVITCGPSLDLAIRKVEFVRKLPHKTLLPGGVPQFDMVLERHRAHGALAVEQAAPAKAKPTVLVSPSWGPSSLFEVFGTGFVKQLAAKYDVIVRPHPQMKVSQPERQAEIEAMQGVVVDTSPLPEESLGKADIMITDYSGIQHEFAFIHEKPVITIAHGTGLGGFEGALFGSTSLIRERCEDFIVPVVPKDIDQLADRVDDVLAKHAAQRGKIAATRAELVYHFGNAGEATADHLVEILRCQ